MKVFLLKSEHEKIIGAFLSKERAKHIKKLLRDGAKKSECGESWGLALNATPEQWHEYRRNLRAKIESMILPDELAAMEKYFGNDPREWISWHYVPIKIIEIDVDETIETA